MSTALSPWFFADAQQLSLNMNAKIYLQERTRKFDGLAATQIARNSSNPVRKAVDLYTCVV